MVVTKDSGQRDEFNTGARRDTQHKKPRFDLIPVGYLDRQQQIFGGGSSVLKDVDRESELIFGELPEQQVVPGSVENLYPGVRLKSKQHPDYRPDLIPHIMINRLAHLYGRGEQKYGANNWQKGIPLSRTYASLFRHMIQWFVGDRSEDHLAAIIWNATSLMWTENAIVHGQLPKELADAGPLGEYFNED